MVGHTRTRSGAAWTVLMAGCAVSVASSAVAQTRRDWTVYAPSENEVTGRVRGNAGSAVAVDVGLLRQTFSGHCGVPNPLPINTIYVDWVAFGPPVPGTFDYQLTVYQDTIDINALVAPTVPFYQHVVPNGVVRLEGLVPSWATPWSQQRIDLNPPMLLNPTKTFAYEIRIFQGGTNLLWPGNAASQSVIVPATQGPMSLYRGTSDIRRWNDPTFSLDGTRPVNFADSFPASITDTANRRNVRLYLVTDALVNNPLCLYEEYASHGVDYPNVPAVRRVELTPQRTEWFAVYVSRPVRRDVGVYYDIRLERDPTAAVDVPSSLGLYTSSGDVLAFDHGEGGGCDIETDTAGLYGMLSFGVGRRAAQAGGYAFDGRDGELSAGTYYLAVSGPETDYGDAIRPFNDGASTSSGSVQLVLTSNIGSQGTSPDNPNTPAAPPQVRSHDTLGSLPGGVTTMDVLRTGDTHVRWVRFDVPPERAVTAAGSNFIDINMNGTLDVDGALGLYNAVGALIAFDRAGGPSTGPGARLGQLSFGGAASGVRPADGDGRPYANDNGNTLPAGAYWLAVGRDADGTPGAMRFDATGWRAYSAAGPYATVTVNLRASTGCRIDYNNDGGVSPDDVGDFLSDYYTSPALAGPGGYAVACVGNAAPYDKGYKAAYQRSGAGQCTPPGPDNLGDYITDYFGGGC